VGGETVWVDGPVIVAMKRGGILLLDEVDLGTVKIMCLQPVLEGKAIFLKKTNTWVKPEKGFNVFLTGNTKGRGDDTGKFVGTNSMNEAFLDRVPETVEQDYPSEVVETKIVKGVLNYLGVTDQDDFAVVIVKWAQAIRKSYAEGAVEDVVTTRRLVQAANALAIYGDRAKAIEKVTTRFDVATRAAFIDLYQKMDASNSPTEDIAAAPTAATPKKSDTSTVKGNCPF
jgi:MoxR-like ATPase